MSRFLSLLMLVIMPTLCVTGPQVSARAAGRPAVVRAGGGPCIKDASKTPAVPSLPGDQFVVHSSTSEEGDAAHVAKTLRTLDVFQTYEKGLGLSSLLQPGQPKPFPVFISGSPLTGDGAFDGLFGPLCDHPAWGALIVDGADAENVEYLDAVVEHELFHAAQFAVLGELTTGSNWWFEATATAAEYWFGSTPDEGVDEVTDHPELPMDFFGNRHQYAAYVFVQWVLKNEGLPTKANWAFLRDSFLKVRSLGPTPGVEEALKTIKQKLGDEVASFWADHLDQLPTFGPKAPFTKSTVDQPFQQVAANPAKPLAAGLASLVPGSNVEQIDVQAEDLPGAIQLWVRRDEKSFSEGPASPLSPTPLKVHPQAGGSFDALFCRSGFDKPAWGSYPLPKTGDVRFALTTTGTTSPGGITLNVITSAKPCPQPITIEPGLEVGPLHLGMTEKQANKAAKAVATQDFTYDGVAVDVVSYQLDNADLAAGYFLNGRLEGVGCVGPAFVTTTGVRITDLQDVFLNSAESHGGADCVEFGHNPTNNHLCSYQYPSTRYTWATVHNDDADICFNPPTHCGPPGPGWHVGSLGIATQHLKAYLPLILSLGS